MFYKWGYKIKSEAIDRLLQRIDSYSAKEQWDKAEAILDRLILGRPWDKKLLLTKAYLDKRKWVVSGCSDHDLLQIAIKSFSRCTLLSGSVEAEINNATLLLISGQREEAYLKAKEAAHRCRKLIVIKGKSSGICYSAIVAEVNLIQERFLAAESWYKTAISQNEYIPDYVAENVQLLLNHHVPDPKIIAKLKNSLRP